jgi:hypothetical protein
MIRDLYEIPASPGQEQMYLIHLRHRGHTPFYLAGGLRIRGTINVAALRQAVAALVERHEVLRTVLRLDRRGHVQQIIRSGAEVELPVVAPPGDPVSWLESYAERPFDLENGPVLRTALAELGDGDHLLAVVIHHIAADGWSLGVLMDDLGELYRSELTGVEPRLPELPLQYADFAVWQRDTLAAGVLDGQLDHWLHRLDGVTELVLPADDVTAAAPTVTTPVRWTPAEVEALAAAARAGGATVFMVLLAGLSAVLSHWSGQTDLVVVSPVAGRGHVELDRTVGYFVNTVPLRVDASGDPTFRELVRRARDTCVDAYANQDVPFDRILAAVARGRPRPALGRVLLAFANTPQPAVDPFPGAVVERVELPPNVGDCDLSLVVDQDDGGGLSGHLVGDGTRFTHSSVDAAASALAQVLAADHDLPLSRLSGLMGHGSSGSEWNGSKVPSRDGCICY